MSLGTVDDDYGDKDNLSLEVNFGELNSCHASDVSSLSFQKDWICDGTFESDSADGFRLTRQASGDSTDSAPGEFPEDTFSNVEEEIRRKVKCSDHKSNKSSLSGSCGGSTVGDEEQHESVSLDSFSTMVADSSETLKRKPKSGSRDDLESTTTDSGTFDHQHHLVSVSGVGVSAKLLGGVRCGSSSSGSISSGIVASISSSDTGIPRTVFDGSSVNMDSCLPSNKALDVTAGNININEQSYSDVCSNNDTLARNPAEIRNNIPNVNNVRHDCRDSKSHPNVSHDLPDVLHKSRKKSPGLAQRLVSPESMAVRGDISGMSSGMVSNMVLRDSVVSNSYNNNPVYIGSTAIDSSVVSAKQCYDARLPVTGGVHTNTNNFSSSTTNQSLVENTDVSNTNNELFSNLTNRNYSSIRGVGKSSDVENEYDYVKYSRVQPQGLTHESQQNPFNMGSDIGQQDSHGDRYVGMRLAYSDSIDSLHSRQIPADGKSNIDHQMHYNSHQVQSNMQPGINDAQLQQLENHLKQPITSSPEVSPENTHMMNYKSRRNLRNIELDKVSQVNEDTLTEIPLNGGNYHNSDHCQQSYPEKGEHNLIPEEKHEFSLSPVSTECDSGEVESVSSVDGKSLNGMPAVEDGLSSSGSSDDEDDNHHEVPIGNNHNLLRQLGLEADSPPAVLPVEQQVSLILLVGQALSDMDE